MGRERIDRVVEREADRLQLTGDPDAVDDSRLVVAIAGLGIACAFVADAVVALATRTFWREDRWGGEPGALDAVADFVRAYRAPEDLIGLDLQPESFSIDERRPTVLTIRRAALRERRREGVVRREIGGQPTRGRRTAPVVGRSATAETRDIFGRMTIDAETAGLVWWRKQRLLEMGFDHRQSYDIAKMVLNLYHLERLLERGCPPLTAVAILS